jgi:endo-1,4-beta-xylanase
MGIQDAVKKLVLVVLVFLVVLTVMLLINNARSNWVPETTLRSLAEDKGITIGSAVAIWPLLNDSTYEDILGREFSILTPENVMKFSFIHPGQDEYDFSYADDIVDFAQEHDMEVRGHCLVWYKELPSWLTEGNWSRDELIDILRDHIYTVVGHFKGRVKYWDVVNEAITGEGGYVESIWYQVIGPEYIEMAFRWAHEADPEALLFYNDYGAEGMNKKSDAIYDLCQKLLDDGVPIDGIGLQMHTNLSLYPFLDDMDSQVSANMERLAKLGLEIHITELDVAISGDVTQEKLEQQADIYRAIFDTCLSVDACKSIVMWGFTDRYSYWNDNPGIGAAFILNKWYQPKPAYYAIVGLLSPEPAGTASP